MLRLLLLNLLNLPRLLLSLLRKCLQLTASRLNPVLIRHLPDELMRLY
jgi:hypothetical protein